MASLSRVYNSLSLKSVTLHNHYQSIAEFSTKEHVFATTIMPVLLWFCKHMWLQFLTCWPPLFPWCRTGQALVREEEEEEFPHHAILRRNILVINQVWATSLLLPTSFSLGPFFSLFVWSLLTFVDECTTGTVEEEKEGKKYFLKIRYQDLISMHPYLERRKKKRIWSISHFVT